MTKRKLTIALLSIFISVVAFAANKDLKRDITMESYEQGWLDSEATLALKNNTKEEVKNVVFQITYLNMSGKELDYEEYSRRVSIAPGMTRKVDIPAYEHDRNYHYYKSENMPGGSPAFKVKFLLKDYNVEEKSTKSTGNVLPISRYDYNRSTDSEQSISDVLIYPILAIIFVLFFIGVWIGLYVLVAVMAQKRHRSVAVWVLLSIIASPILIVIILLVIGNDENYIEDE